MGCCEGRFWTIGARWMILTLLVWVTEIPTTTVASPTPDVVRSPRAQRLARRLLGIDDTGGDSISRILAKMDTVEQRLSRALDPGDVTQGIQRQILKDLEDAITAAIRRGSGESSAHTPSGEKRSAGQGRSETPPTSTPAESARSPGRPVGTGGDTDKTQREGPLRESRRGWGTLPQRDRDEILQGMNEQSLEKFREWIEEYYKALSEGDGP